MADLGGLFRKGRKLTCKLTLLVWCWRIHRTRKLQTYHMSGRGPHSSRFVRQNELVQSNIGFDKKLLIVFSWIQRSLRARSSLKISLSLYTLVKNLIFFVPFSYPRKLCSNYVQPCTRWPKRPELSPQHKISGLEASLSQDWLDKNAEN